MKRNLFFDLDGTVTPSRQKIHPEMYDLLTSLPATIIIVSGSQNNQIRFQIGDLPCFKLGQNGNRAENPEGHLLWEHTLSVSEKEEVYKHIEIVHHNLTHSIPDETDLIEDRGSQISFSIYGHHASPEEKRACDGDFLKRKALLASHPFVSETLEVQIGGTTCFDYFKKGFHKGRNTEKLIEMMKWEKESCVYFGDALFEGGNDSSVVHVIDTVPVTDEKDTYAMLKDMFPGN